MLMQYRTASLQFLQSIYKEIKSNLTKQAGKKLLII